MIPIIYFIIWCILCFISGFVISFWKLNTIVLHLDNEERKRLLAQSENEKQAIRQVMNEELIKARADAHTAMLRMQSLQNIIVMQHDQWQARIEALEKIIKELIEWGYSKAGKSKRKSCKNSSN